MLFVIEEFLSERRPDPSPDAATFYLSSYLSSALAISCESPFAPLFAVAEMHF